MGYKTIMFFNLKADERRRVERVVGKLDRFADRVYRLIVRDEYARGFICAAQKAMQSPLRFLVMDEGAFAAGWGVTYGDAAFGGPFGAA
jgi:hypothetical protein